MAKFIMVCGLPGCSKDTVCDKLVKDNNVNYIKIDSSVQDTSMIVKRTILNKINTSLSDGKDVVYNSFNLKCDSRSKLLSMIEVPCEKICYFVADPIDVCYNISNISLFEFNLMVSTMTLPWYYEGWDEIKLIKKFIQYDRTTEELFNQLGLNYTKNMIDDPVPSIYNAKYINHKKAIDKNTTLDYYSIKAVLFHKCWKYFYTEVLKEHVPDCDDKFSISAYISLFYEDNSELCDNYEAMSDNTIPDALHSAVIIQWLSVFDDTDDDTKVSIIKLFGKELSSEIINVKHRIRIHS